MESSTSKIPPKEDMTPENRPNFTDNVEKTAKQFDVLRPYQFLEDFKAETHNLMVFEQDPSKRRVWAQAMDAIFFGPATKKMFKTILGVTERNENVDARLYIDGFNDTFFKGYTLVKKDLKEKKLSFKNFEEAFSQARIDLLIENGVDVEKVNPVKKLKDKILFIKGRNHIKIYLVGDKIWIGGMNLTEEEFNKYEDFTVKITDPRITEIVARQFPQINENRPKNDYEVKCTENTTLLVDSGKPKESIILDRVTERVNRGQKRVLLATQFRPEGKFLETLHDAYKRDLEFVCLQSDPKVDDIFAKILNLKNRLEARRYPIPVTVLPGTKIHAKLLIVDDTAFFGSHNFSYTGVKAGTEEMDIMSTEPVLVNNLTEYFRELQSIK